MKESGRWRLILDGKGSASFNMAKDEAILRGLEQGRGLPCLRLYQWQGAAISIGRHQSPGSLQAAIDEFDLPVVRRITGGRGVLHYSELTYSVVCDASHELFSYGIHGAYRAISQCIVEALKALGVGAELTLVGSANGRLKKDSCFHAPARFEVMAGGRKIVGSSQRRFKGALLQHGSILFGMDRAMTDGVFGRGASERMSWVSEFTGAGIEDLVAVLPQKVSVGLGVIFEESEPCETEETLVKTLERTRYLNSAWNLSGTEEAAEDALDASGRLDRVSTI